VPASVPKPTRSVPQVSIADDIIAIEYAAGLVPTEFHGHALWDAGADHVANGGPPEVVPDAPRTPGRHPARCRTGRPRVIDLLVELFAAAARARRVTSAGPDSVASPQSPTRSLGGGIMAFTNTS
jgi:hypothetical protein